MTDERPQLPASKRDVVDAELLHHSRRIGIEWPEVAARLIALHPELLAGLEVFAGDPVISFDPQDMLPMLRAIPDGAGVDGVVRALEGSYVSTRAQDDAR